MDGLEWESWRKTAREWIVCGRKGWEDGGMDVGREIEGGTDGERDGGGRGKVGRREGVTGRWRGEERGR